MRLLLAGLAALLLGLSHGQAGAVTVVINPSVTAVTSCQIANGKCASYDDFPLILGGVQQGLIFFDALEYALPVLPQHAVLTSASLSIGAYSRYGENGFQGFQNGAIGTIDLTSYVGNGSFDAGDTDHRGKVDVTLSQAATSLYDVTGLVSALQGAGDAYLGFSIYQNPPGECGFGFKCEVQLTGDTVAFADAFQPRLFVDYTISAAVPEPSTWAMMLLGFAGVGAMAYRTSRKDLPLAA